MKPETAVHCTISLFVMLALPGTANARSAADELPPALLACAEEVDVMRRLSCYDREMAALKATPGNLDAPVAAEPAAVPADKPPREAIPEPAPEPVVAVATTASPEPARKQAPEPAPAPPATAAAPAAAPAPRAAPADDFGLEDQGPTEFTATVTSIRAKPYGELIILLDNGQIWEQKHVDRRFRLDIGDQVTISKGLISGYRLSDSSHASIQVERRQ